MLFSCTRCVVKLYRLHSLQPPADEGAEQPWSRPDGTQHGRRGVVSGTDTVARGRALTQQALIQRCLPGGRKHAVAFLVSSSFGVDGHAHGHHHGGRG